MASSHTKSSTFPEEHEFKSSQWTSLNAQEVPASGRVSPNAANQQVTWGGGMLMKAMGHSGSNLATAEVISLDSIRSTLIRQVRGTGRVELMLGTGLNRLGSCLGTSSEATRLMVCEILGWMT